MRHPRRGRDRTARSLRPARTHIGTTPAWSP